MKLLAEKLLACCGWYDFQFELVECDEYSSDMGDYAYSTIVRLSATTAMVVYTGSDDDSTYACIATLNDSIDPPTVNLGTSFVVLSSETAVQPSTIALSSSVVLMTYVGDYSGGADPGRAVLIHTNGTIETPVTFDNRSCYEPRIVAISATEVIVVYSIYDTTIYDWVEKACVLTVASNIISVGTITDIFDAEAEDTSLFLLSDTQVMFAYRDTDNSHYGTAMVINFDSSRTLTPGTPFVFSSESTSEIAGVALSETNALLGYRKRNGAGELRIINANGTVGDPSGFNTKSYYGMVGGEVSSVSIAMLPNSFNDCKIVICYKHEDAGGHQACRVCMVSVFNNIITVGKPVVVNTESYITKAEIIAFSTTKILVNTIFGIYPITGTVCLLSKE